MKAAHLVALGLTVGFSLAGLAAIAQPAKAPLKAAPAPQAVGPKIKDIAQVSTKRGEKVFVEYCAVCHGLHGQGDGPRAAHFADIQYIPDFTAQGFLDGRDAEVLTAIRDGLARLEEPLIVMPQFKYILSENDIKSVHAYVKSLAAPATPPTKGNAKR